MFSARKQNSDSILKTISDLFLPIEMRESRSPQARRQRIFILSNLFGPIMVGIITLTTWLLLGYLDPNSPVSLASTSLSIVWIVTIRLGVPYEHIIALALLHFIGITGWFAWIDGGLHSGAMPWLVVMPIICVFFASGWPRYLGLFAVTGCIVALIGASINGYAFPTVTDNEVRSISVGISSLFAAIYLGVMGSIMTTLNERDEERLGTMANHDALTSTLNRRGLQNAFDELMPGPHCLVALDLDHFKSVNDRYGHETGDHVLTEFAERLRDSLRRTDSISRLGGEEFAIIMRNTTQNVGYAIIDRIRQEIANQGIAIPGNTEAELVTFSAGLISLDCELNLDVQLNQADELMYKAKHQGRNQVHQEKVSALSQLAMAN